MAPGIVESLKIVTEAASLRIARPCLRAGRARGAARVCTVHKANILKLSDGCLLECARRVARDHPGITYREIIIDNCCMQLVKHPAQFDVLLLENLYGDILSDLCAGLVGGLGVVPGANLGESCAVFEAVHGSAPDIADQNLAETAWGACPCWPCRMLASHWRAGLSEARAGSRPRVLVEGRVSDARFGAVGHHVGIPPWSRFSAKNGVPGRALGQAPSISLI